MLKVGLTGGIGSGKSTVARILETLGIPVYYADSAARRLMNEDPELKEKLKQEFGLQTYNEEGLLDRRYLAACVFNDATKLDKLNAITHPATIADAENWMTRQHSPYAVKEAALIFESGSSAGLDLIVGVWVPAPLRIRRTMQRDGSDRQAVLDRMNRQIEESIKMKLCDIVLNNDEQQLLLPQVLQLHEHLLKQAMSH